VGIGFPGGFWQTPFPLIIGGVLLVAGIALYISSRYRRATLTEILEVDTYSARDLRLLVKGEFSATAEVKGIVRCKTPITTPVTASQCVWYHTEVKRKYETTRTERDAQGHTRTVTETHWETVHEEGRGVPFEVHDETGITHVVPEGADVEPVTVYDQFMYHVPWFDVGWRFGTKGYQVTERIFPPDVPAYILGQADYDKNLDAPIIHYPSRGYTDPKRRTFFITMRTEEEVTRSSKRAVAWLWWSGAICMLAGVGVLIAWACVSGRAPGRFPWP
jgi:hypothetical protein